MNTGASRYSQLMADTLSDIVRKRQASWHQGDVQSAAFMALMHSILVPIYTEMRQFDFDDAKKAEAEATKTEPEAQ